MNRIVVVVNIILLISTVNAEDSKIFPSGFSFGVGTTAYQIEGAWNIEGKSENIWDHWIHNDPTHIKNNDTADVACDCYKNILFEFECVTEMNVEHYHFSIPWSRILPSGFSEPINVLAISHYQDMIEALMYYDITPVVTLHHHDLPQSLQDIGGWENPDMVKYFVDYARVCFQYFHNVKYWITFNDPRATCRYGYGDGSYAPGIAHDGTGEYVCAQTVLKAHAAAYHLYKEEFEKLNGKVSIALDLRWSEPARPNDTTAVERRNAFEFGLYANPIYKGNWPEEVIDRVGYRSKNEKLTKSRLPEFTKEEIDYINGTSDFMAVNIFYANIVEDTEEAEFGDPSYSKDMRVKIYMNSSWELAVNGQPIVPATARASLTWLQSQFNDPKIFITGNGVPDENIKADTLRISYIREYLSAILEAINIDKVKVFGYTAWSLFDGFEWTDGYSYKFGFYHVDSSHPWSDGAKSSVNLYTKIANTLTIPSEETTTSSTSTITTTTTTTLPDTTPSPGSATKIFLYPGAILITVFLCQQLL